ncbi:MAG: hypothetical protein JOZ43_07930, partial [Acidobacteriales bacterium]|nr:hypothetical protein [Terriglobales bacterium]
MFEGNFSAPPEEKRDYKPLLLGIVAVAIILAAVIFIFQRREGSQPSASNTGPATPDLYAQNLPLADVKMS